MALHIFGKSVTFYDVCEGEPILRVAQWHYIWWMQKIVQKGESHAIKVKDFLKQMGKTDTDSHRRRVREAADYCQVVLGVLVCSTTSGYFIAETEDERGRCMRQRQKEARSLHQRITRLQTLQLGKSFSIHRHIPKR